MRGTATVRFRPGAPSRELTLDTGAITEDCAARVVDFLFLLATLWAVAVKVWMSCTASEFTGSYHAVFVNVFPGTPSPS